MIPIIYSSGITAAFAVYNVLSQRAVKTWVYILLFFSLFVTTYLIENNLCAETVRGPFEHEIVVTERGAASLSQLAMEGASKPQNCKFPCEVDRVILTEAIEILECTEKSRQSISVVRVWSC